MSPRKDELFVLMTSDELDALDEARLELLASELEPELV